MNRRTFMAVLGATPLAPAIWKPPVDLPFAKGGVVKSKLPSVMWEMDVLYGAQVVNPNAAAKLADIAAGSRSGKTNMRVRKHLRSYGG